MGHNHSHNHTSTKNIKIAFYLNLCFTILEIIGGIYVNSIAIISDAIHDLGDTISLGTAWYLDVKSKKKADKKFLSNNKKDASSLGTALKLSTEMVAAVFVGSIIGFILDNWFGSKPWLTIIFFFAGATAGIINVIRSAKLMQKNNN